MDGQYRRAAGLSDVAVGDGISFALAAAHFSLFMRGQLDSFARHESSHHLHDELAMVGGVEHRLRVFARWAEVQLDDIDLHIVVVQLAQQFGIVVKRTTENEPYARHRLSIAYLVDLVTFSLM